jgi:hypothetical protein
MSHQKDADAQDNIIPDCDQVGPRRFQDAIVSNPHAFSDTNASPPVKHRAQ